MDREDAVNVKLYVVPRNFKHKSLNSCFPVFFTIHFLRFRVNCILLKLFLAVNRCHIA